VAHSRQDFTAAAGLKQQGVQTSAGDYPAPVNNRVAQANQYMRPALAGLIKHTCLQASISAQIRNSLESFFPARTVLPGTHTGAKQFAFS
jgi:hypothetical protein